MSTDRLTPAQRSALMKSVRRENTTPEIRVRSTAHKIGFRFRLHRRDLPGTPDLVFPKYRVCIFVHGCFWHRHEGCKKATTPKTRKEYWKPKFAANIERDRRKTAELEALGWKVGVIWECDTNDQSVLEDRLKEILTGN